MLDNTLSKSKDGWMLSACVPKFKYIALHNTLIPSFSLMVYSRLSFMVRKISNRALIPSWPMYLLHSLWKWVEVLLALLCQLTGTGIMTWGKLLSFLSGVEGEDVNCPSLSVFLYLVYFHWYSQLHSYSQLSVFLVRIGTRFWLMLCYNFQAKY